MAMFQRGPGGFFRPRTQRLTQLYLDTKLSYEAAKVIPSEVRTKVASGKFGVLKKGSGDDVTAALEDPEDISVVTLRREFQFQQDRLLAWGVFWAEIGASQAQSDGPGNEKTKHGHGAGYEGHAEIDRKIDQAGLGDVVASVMEEIKKLLDESGRLQHPERWEQQQQQLQQQHDRKSPQQHQQQQTKAIDREKEKVWREYEVKTGRVLLEQLTECIDVLYSLVDGQEGEDQTTKGMSDILRNTSGNDEPEPDPTMAQVFAHPLYIDFARLQPMHDPNVDDELTEPPSYDDIQNAGRPQTRSIYFYGDAQVHVIVDLIATRSIASDHGSDSPLQRMYDLAANLSGGGLLSWDGHLKVLGFTLAGSKANSRFGLVYALPAPSDPTALQQYQTLTSTIVTSHDHDASIPPLENKFRLAYNVALLVTGYLARNSTHGHLRSSNFVFLRESDPAQRGQLGQTLRCPYMMQPIESLVGLPTSQESLQEIIYHHPDADEAGYGSVAAHDIYSVGLILFEIGIWAPLRRFWKPKYHSDRHIFSDRVRKTYSPKLASKCGSRYMKAVQKCLDAPTELVENPTNVDAAEYLLEVVRDLAHCCALDEVGQPSNLDIDIFEAMIEELRQSLPMQVEELALKMKLREKALPTLPVELPTETESQIQSRVHASRKCKTSQPRNGKSALRKFPDLPIPQQHLTAWNTNLMPRLQRLLTSCLATSRESASVSLMMIGPSPERAVTTIVIQCTESHTAKIHEELKAKLKGKMKLGKGWGLVVLKGDVRRSGRRGPNTEREEEAKRSGLQNHTEAEKSSRDSSQLQQRDYQKRPESGASIGAFKNGEHLPPVTFGGTILLDGKPFGMSVHHMLDDVSERGSEDEADSDDENSNQFGDAKRSRPQRSTTAAGHIKTELEAIGSHMHLSGSGSDLDELEISDAEFDSGEAYIDNDYESESDTSTIRPEYSTFDDDGNEVWFADDASLPDLDDDDSLSSDSGDEDAASIGDRPGFDRYTQSFDEDDELCITQPALDDVDEDFFPSIEDRDDDHLSSHSFGFVHATSGIRRAVKNDMKHEIDWALIQVDEERCGYTAARSDKRFRSRRHAGTNLWRASPESYLTNVATLSSLPNRSVTSVGRTTGLSAGKISQAMSLVKFHGRTSFSSSFTVEGGLGVPGDSGAWIWAADGQELCGHVLAWADGLKVAFMSPMEVMFEDIKEQLGVDSIELVGAVMDRERRRSESTIKGKQAAKTEVEVLANRVAAKKLNDQLDRARELEVALKRISLSSAGGSHVASSRNTSQDGRGNGRAPDHVKVEGVAVAVDKTGLGRSNGGDRNRKERFDAYVSSGKELTSLPMARALS